MEIRNIISFLKVAELKSFSKAAIELGYSQSNITMQIKQLENELHCTLFNRIGKKISLTEHGNEFIEYAGSIRLLVENAKLSLSDNPIPSGQLIIGVLESLCITYLPKLIHEFYNKYPQVNTIIKIGTYEELSSLLNNNAIDLLWTFDDSITNKNWLKALEFPNAIKLIASPNHSLIQKNQSIHFSSLKNCTFIFTEQNCSYRNYFENLLQSQAIPYHVFLEIGNTEIIKKFVESGLCLSVLPEFSIQYELYTKKLAVVNIRDFHLNMYCQIFYHKNKIPTSAMKEFLHHLQSSLPNM
ncbi:LysR family transcriptional regulator [Lacrimispora sp. 38-1]|uniref:LysR family transcriptional regulator n=1 Tax=Lacrimispora sp. 38-1 TaxID=3125778 RepID=UPI003CEEFA2A